MSISIPFWYLYLLALLPAIIGCAYGIYRGSKGDLGDLLAGFSSAIFGVVITVICEVVVLIIKAYGT